LRKIRRNSLDRTSSAAFVRLTHQIIPPQSFDTHSRTATTMIEQNAGIKVAAAVFSINWPTDETATKIIAVAREYCTAVYDVYRGHRNYTTGAATTLRHSLSGNRDIFRRLENGVGRRLFLSTSAALHNNTTDWPVENIWFHTVYVYLTVDNRDNFHVVNLRKTPSTQPFYPSLSETLRCYTWSLFSLYRGMYNSTALFTPLINQYFSSLIRNYNKVSYN